jgi:indolepyruvate ferredoxin oxidoreductase alpha subunit
MNEQLTKQPGSRMLALGNEAIARGAVEAGVQVVAAYPGTPSSEIVETLIDLAPEYGHNAQWSINEKVAFEVAAGASIVGARALASMKGAGLNWAMDPLMTLPLTGVRAGFVVVVADDPGAHYSSNEQDSRLAAQWAGIPCFEPETQQDALEMTKAAIFLSEEIELPVLLRSVTRISHSSGIIQLGEIQKSEAKIGFNKHWKIPFRWNVYGPPNLVGKHQWQMNQLAIAQQWVEGCTFNQLVKKNSKLGIVGVGLGAGYAREAMCDLGLEDKVNFLKVGVPYPFAKQKAEEILRSCNKVLVVEEGMPFYEDQLRAYAQTLGSNVQIFGRNHETPLFSSVGELTSDNVYEVVASFSGQPVKAALTDENRLIFEQVKEVVIPRSSALCAGCPHLGSYAAIEKALPQGARVVPIMNGDIGCYEQAGYGVQGQMPKASDQDSRRAKPMSVYNTLDTLYVMGSGISMAQGELAAGYSDGPIVAVCGDSTFFHATMPALMNAVWNKSNVTFIVMDNSWTAMTGHQPSPMTNKPANAGYSIESIVRGMGVEYIRVVDGYDIEGVTEAVKGAVEFDGVAVVITRRECALQVFRKSTETGHIVVTEEKCTGCKKCIILGCPAILFENGKAGIDKLMCVNCGICVQVCPEHAIVEEVLS